MATIAQETGIQKRISKIRKYVCQLLQTRSEFGYRVSPGSRKNTLRISFGTLQRMNAKKIPTLDEIQIVDIEMMIRQLIAKFKLIFKNRLNTQSRLVYEFAL